ncbi:MAG: PilN domain-containing protein [Chromatiales bacterium]|nr:PilN domain-containing protein [Chromatiales bacterium]
MAHINLLPWREALRKQKKQEYFSAVGISVGLMVVIWGAVHFYMASQIDNQIARNNILKNEINIVEKKIEEIKGLEKQKEQLIARMQVIEELQGDRPAIVYIFDELARAVPEGLYMETVEQKNSSITIKGKAQSNARVSAFMRSLEESEWFKTPVLDEIKTTSGRNRSDREFTLIVQQDKPKVEEEKRGGKK